MAKSTAHANAVLNAIGDMTLHEATWVSLHTGDPGTTGASEASGGNYGRVEVNEQGGSSPCWGSASNGSLVNSGKISFPKGGDDDECTHFGIWDAQTNGNFIRGGELSSPIEYGANVTPEIEDGDLELTEA